MVLQKSPFEIKIDFWFDVNATLLPFSLLKSIKLASKLDLGRHQLFDRCLHRFLLIVVRFGKPTWRHVVHFFVKMWGTISWCAPSFVGSMFFFFFLSSWPPLGAIWGRFGKVWGSILEGFWDRFWKELGFIL